MKYQIRYGKEALGLEVAPERLVGVLAPAPVQAVPDVAAATRAALQAPLHGPPLADLLAGRKSALIVTVDHTRPSPRLMLLEVIAACRRAGVAPKVIIATGRHRRMRDDELAAHLGSDILQQVPVLQHDAFDESVMVTRGTTARGTPIRLNKIVFEHDVVIGVGIIEPSYLCGWSGGRKLLMPGLAHHASIDNNHYYLTHPDARIGRLHGNPVSDDSAEFAKDLPLHFIVYSVSGPADEAAAVVAGAATATHEDGCRLCESIYTVPRVRADVVVSSAGGWPYDCDLVQGKKAVIPAIEVVKPNGVIILCAECRDGLGAEKTFIDWLRNKRPVEVVRDVKDRAQFSLGAHGANILARPVVEKNARVVLVTNPAVAAQLQGTYLIALSDLAQAWQLADLIAGPQSSVALIEKARRLIVR